jgi:hypothetical protein
LSDVFGLLEGFEGQLLSLPESAKIISPNRHWLHGAGSLSDVASLDLLHKQ